MANNLALNKRIKPRVKEVSFAYDPCNMRRFLMMKEKDMDEILQILQDSEPLLKESEVEALLKEKKISEAAKKGVKSALRILNKFKGELPKGILSTLAKAAPEYGAYAEPEETEDEKKKKAEELEKMCTAKVEEKLKKDLLMTPDVKLLKDEVGALRKSLEGTEVELKKTRDELNKEKDSRRIEAIRTELSEAKVLGKLDVLAKQIFSIEQVDVELAKQTIQMHKDVAKKMESVGAFTSVGSGGGDSFGLNGGAYQKLRAKQEETLQKDKSLSPGAAWKRTIKENPDLYREYVNER